VVDVRIRIIGVGEMATMVELLDGGTMLDAAKMTKKIIIMFENGDAEMW
jgi:hypothetical protein